MFLGDAFNWAKYRLYKPITFGLEREAGRVAGNAVRSTARAARRAAPSIARGSLWGARNVVFPAAKGTIDLAINTGLQAGNVAWNWGMGRRGLFYSIENPAIKSALKAGASNSVLKRLGYEVEQRVGETAEQFASRQAASAQTITFNQTLRKRLWHGAIGIAAFNSMRSLGDSRIPVYDESGISQRNMGADGDLALSMYYNQK